MRCSVIFCEAAAIYGVIVAIILQTKIEYVKKPEGRLGLYPHNAIFSGYAILSAGLTTGFANLACGCAAAYHLFTSVNTAAEPCAVHAMWPSVAAGELDSMRTINVVVSVCIQD
jgi:F0F1-type ATP synthase membrane subunit c/vacuolar-type H+-ATPase subunit K